MEYNEREWKFKYYVQKITYIVKEKLCVCHTSGIMNPLIRARSPVIVVTKLSHFLQKKFHDDDDDENNIQMSFSWVSFN